MNEIVEPREADKLLFFFFLANMDAITKVTDLLASCLD